MSRMRMGLGKTAFRRAGQSVGPGSQSADASCIGEALSDFLERLGPGPGQYDTVATALRQVLPENLRPHCRVAGFSNGCLKIAADASSYVYELQLCKDALLAELQRLCPAARVRRIDVGIARF